MEKSELMELSKALRLATKAGEVEKLLAIKPGSVFALRLAAGLSQRQFLRRLKYALSHTMLIKHEKGKTKRMRKSLAKTIARYAPKNIDIKTIDMNYKKFESMKHGVHMTSERAKQLQKLSLKVTSRSQRQAWGRLGAMKTNSMQRLTSQEKDIAAVLDKLKFSYKIHKLVKNPLINMNVDFVIYKNSRPVCFIEATNRRHDLPVLYQAYAYRNRVLKEIYPKALFVIVSSLLPLMVKEIVKREFDYVAKSAGALEKFLSSIDLSDHRQRT
ncbi:MAG: hypothetical protein ACE5J7_00310 [Candidatus Aenigmatarchaeota archaeon]